MYEHFYELSSSLRLSFFLQGGLDFLHVCVFVGACWYVCVCVSCVCVCLSMCVCVSVYVVCVCVAFTFALPESEMRTLGLVVAFFSICGSAMVELILPFLFGFGGFAFCTHLRHRSESCGYVLFWILFWVAFKLLSK